MPHASTPTETHVFACPECKNDVALDMFRNEKGALLKVNAEHKKPVCQRFERQGSVILRRALDDLGANVEPRRVD